MFLPCQISQTVIFGLGMAALIMVEGYRLSLACGSEAKTDQKTYPDHPTGSLDRT